MRTRQHGFTLLEMLGAIAVLTLGFALLLDALQSSVALTRHANARSEAVLWAQSLLDSRYAMRDLHPGSSSGRFDDRYRWQLQVRRWRAGRQRNAADASPVRLYRLDLTVQWGPEAHPHSLHLSTLRAAGPPSNARAGLGPP